MTPEPILTIDDLTVEFKTEDGDRQGRDGRQLRPLPR